MENIHIEVGDNLKDVLMEIIDKSDSSHIGFCLERLINIFRYNKTKLIESEVKGGIKVVKRIIELDLGDNVTRDEESKIE